MGVNFQVDGQKLGKEFRICAKRKGWNVTMKVNVLTSDVTFIEILKLTLFWFDILILKNY